MRICKVEGCKNRHEAKGYCNRHYIQIRKYGRIIGNPQQSQNDPNEFIIDDDICKIKLYDPLGNHKATAIIDAKDYERVKNRKWYLHDGYVVERKTRLRLHQIIMGKPKKGFEIDHRDRIKLNNRKQNLRICTRAENSRNSIKPINNTSGYKGVSWDKQAKMWMAYITKNCKRIYLGLFTSLTKAALEHFGKFARLNVI